MKPTHISMSKVKDFSELSGMGHVKMGHVKGCNLGLLLLAFCESAMFISVCKSCIETLGVVLIIRNLYTCLILIKFVIGLLEKFLIKQIKP